ncbi:MAG: TIR domain-containing protein [Phototrophicaceae bacterium]
MSDIFVSYSRRDSTFVAELHNKLVAEGHDVWVDWEDIPPTADWWAEIKSAIEEAHIFAFVISPNSVRSDICRDEIQHAIDNNKRFIPILFQEIEDIDAPYVHSAIRSHNWIPFISEDIYESSFKKLTDAFTTEPDYLRRHTRLLVRAKEWITNNRQPSYMLEGAELREFQAWLERSHTREPKPTELQYEYILASQTQRTRNQLRWAGGIIIGFSVVAILSIFAIFQQRQLQNQQTLQATIEGVALAQSTQIAAQKTRIAAVQVNATGIIQDANIQNTQSALQGQIISFQGTIAAFETRAAVTNTPIPTALPTITSTLPPTWTPTVVSESAEAASVGDDDAEPTLDPNIGLTATAQQSIYATATQVAQASPTPLPSDTPTLTPLPPTPTMVVAELAPIQTISYVVQEGDFAVDIAARFNVSVRDIMNANAISNPSLIFAGQQLLIPFQTDLETDETLVVAPTGDDTRTCGTALAPCRTINGAIQVARGFAEIRVAPGIYQEQLTLTQDVVIIGNGVESTIVTGDFTGTILTVNPDVRVNLIGMTITGGNALWGGGIANYGTVNLQNMRISGNVAELAGGGVANFGTLIGEFTDFIDNYAPLYIDIYSAPDAGLVINDSMNFMAETSLPDLANVDGELNIGALVLVSTTDGDALNLRPETSTNNTPLLRMPAGTPLLIIDGPRRSTNYRWWQVQTSTGVIGWAADFDDEPTLTRIREPLPILPTESP